MIKFDRAPALPIASIDPLFEICNRYRESHGPAESFGFETEVNLLCKIDTRSDRHTLDEFKEKIDADLLTYLIPAIEQASAAGVKTISTLRAWIHGNDSRLPHCSITQLSGHSHHFGLMSDPTPTNTYTIITPLRITDDVTEFFWASRVDNIVDTVPNKVLLLDSPVAKATGVFQKSDKLRNDYKEALQGWWSNLRAEHADKEMRTPFPGADEQLILTFNSKHWVHGIDNIKNNLYLIILFDNYTYE